MWAVNSSQCQVNSFKSERQEVGTFSAHNSKIGRVILGKERQNPYYCWPDYSLHMLYVTVPVSFVSEVPELGSTLRMNTQYVRHNKHG